MPSSFTACTSRRRYGQAILDKIGDDYDGLLFACEVMDVIVSVGTNNRDLSSAVLSHVSGCYPWLMEYAEKAAENYSQQATVQ